MRAQSRGQAMLVIEIALGIVLAVLILNFLPQILAGGLVLGAVAIGALIVVAIVAAAWAAIEPFRAQLQILLGAFMFLFMACWALSRVILFLLPQLDPPLDQAHR